MWGSRRAVHRRPLPICIWLVVGALLAVLAPAAYGARAWQAPLELSAPGADAWVGKQVPSLAVGPDGRVVVAWREGEGDSAAVKVVEKPRAEPSTDPQLLGAGTNPPSVATTPLGRAYVAWVGSLPGGGPGDTVYVSERQDGGGYGAPQVLASGTGEGALQPGTAVAANDRGDAIVLFTQGSWNDQQLFSARRTRDGVWHEPQPVSEPLGEAVWRLHAGMSETGEAIFAWLSWHVQNGTSAWTAIAPVDGPATDVRRMQDDGNRSSMPSIAVDKLGNAIVAWIDEPADESVIVGRVRAAVRAPGEPFGAPIDVGGAATDFDPVTVGLSDDAHAVVAWQGASPNGPNGASVWGAIAAVGVVPAGVFGPAEDIGLLASPLLLAVDPVGNAVFFGDHGSTSEMRIVRRSVAGFFGHERTVLPCPRQMIYPLAAAVDPLGNATLLWTENNWRKASQALMLSQDSASTTFTPDPCPAPPPPLTWSPKDPEPGDAIAFDASGFMHPDLTTTTFRWDLDGDGTFDTAASEDPTASTTFDSPGEKQIGLQVHEEVAPNDGATWTCYYPLRVGSPPDPPNEFPRAWTDPRPPDLPDEDPWPLGPKTNPPPVELPPVELPPAEPPVGSPPLGDGPSPPTTLPAGTRLALGAPKSIKAKTLLKSGVSVRLAGARSQRARVRLLAKGRRSPVAGPTTVRIGQGGGVLVHLELTRAGRQLVRKRRVGALVVEAAPQPRGAALRQQIRLR
jgi:hypothetical protein